MKTLIALCGPIGAGKTTLAMTLARDYNFRYCPFAHPIRKMIQELIAHQGVPMQEAWEWVTAKKELPCPWLEDRTPRHAMQTLGTEWGRNLMHPEFWIRIWRRKVERFAHVVVDDLRFPNEAAEVNRLGGTIVEIEREGVVYTGTHASEQHERLFFRNRTITNNEKPEEMMEQIRDLL